MSKILKLIFALSLILINFSINLTTQIFAEEFEPTSIELEVVNLTNAERAKVGRAPLKINKNLTASARKYAQLMCSTGHWGHTGPDGSQPATRMFREGYAGQGPWGEIIASGQSSPTSVLNSWMNSPPHKAIILNGNITEVGAGFAQGACWVQNFGGGNGANYTNSSVHNSTNSGNFSSQSSQNSNYSFPSDPIIPRSQSSVNNQSQKPTYSSSSITNLSSTSNNTSGPVAALSDYENQVLYLTNQERKKSGLLPVSYNSKLTTAARAHAQDMCSKNYFSHDSQDGRKFNERINAAGYDYITVGENIAMGQPTAQNVMTAWMNSEGHRRNILNKSFKELGIGAIQCGNGAIYWVQDFGLAKNGVENPDAIGGNIGGNGNTNGSYSSNQNPNPTSPINPPIVTIPSNPTNSQPVPAVEIPKNVNIELTEKDVKPDGTLNKGAPCIKFSNGTLTIGTIQANGNCRIIVSIETPLKFICSKNNVRPGCLCAKNAGDLVNGKLIINGNTLTCQEFAKPTQMGRMCKLQEVLNEPSTIEGCYCKSTPGSGLVDGIVKKETNRYRCVKNEV